LSIRLSEAQWWQKNVLAVCSDAPHPPANRTLMRWGMDERVASELVNPVRALPVRAAHTQRPSQSKLVCVRAELWWEHRRELRKGYGQEMPARDLQRCLLTLFRHAQPPPPKLIVWAELTWNNHIHIG
jgi:hypothetical protein